MRSSDQSLVISRRCPLLETLLKQSEQLKSGPPQMPRSRGDHTIQHSDQCVILESHTVRANSANASYGMRTIACERNMRVLCEVYRADHAMRSCRAGDLNE